jgi:hypothetical protein
MKRPEAAERWRARTSSGSNLECLAKSSTANRPVVYIYNHRLESRIKKFGSPVRREGQNPRLSLSYLSPAFQRREHPMPFLLAHLWGASP